MNFFLQIFILFPFVGFVLSLLIPKKNEYLLSRLAYYITLIQLNLSLFFIIYWVYRGAPDLNLKEITLYDTAHYTFFIDFYFDKISAVYLFIGSLLTFMVTTYSRYYLHREKGYKRFFNTVLFFFWGYTITILSGNFETLFIGWEILGLSSFLLIAFYRERYLPVTNAFKVYSYYRIGDIGIILAMWGSHHLFHENITFMKLDNAELVSEHLTQNSYVGMFISISLLIAASAKSAQLPFSSWLPRAMEGPTPSSAIFYGSLSVHLGAFLLMRTYPFWENQLAIKILIIFLGLTTSLVASSISRVQSSAKAQIAYSSISQIGIIFIEIALGLEALALIHFMGNAFLRTYQLLVSPSVVSYMIREQFYTYEPREHTFEDSLPKKMENTLFTLSLKEYNLEEFMAFIFWTPLKRIGNSLDFITFKNSFLFFAPTFFLGLVALYYQNDIPPYIKEYLPTVFSFIGMVLVFKAYSERKSPFLAWILVVLNHFWLALAISFNEKVDYSEIIMYLSGVSIAGILGLLVLYLFHKKEREHFNLKQYHGHIYEHPKYAMLFLLCALGVTGFPITTTFIGEDLVFSHIRENQVALAVFASQSFIIGGLAGVRIYARLFLGPHTKTYHELPYQSS